MSSDVVVAGPGTAADNDPERVSRGRRSLLTPGAAWQLPLVIVLVALGSALVTPDFLAADNIRAILVTASVTGVVAVSMTAVTLSGHFFSLSTEQSALLGAMLFAWLVGTSGVPVFLGLVITLVVVALTGALQGVVVAIGLNPIITTLAAGSVIGGLVSRVSHNESVTTGGAAVSWLGTAQPLGVPAAVIIFAIVTLVCTILSSGTVAGRQTLLTGANSRAAVLAGVPVKRVAVLVFAMVAAGSGLAGVMTASTLGYASTQMFATLTFDVIAAVLVGGTSIHGGAGSPLRSAGGAILIAEINSLMLLNNVTAGTRITVQGALVLAVIAILHTRRSR
jgi:ribose transport system permease protein